MRLHKLLYRSNYGWCRRVGCDLRRVPSDWHSCLFILICYLGLDQVEVLCSDKHVWLLVKQRYLSEQNSGAD